MNISPNMQKLISALVFLVLIFLANRFFAFVVYALPSVVVDVLLAFMVILAIGLIVFSIRRRH